MPPVTKRALATQAGMATMSASRSDGELMLHAPPGFLAWVAQLVHAHRGRLLAYARSRGLDSERALDAVQDAFISFLRLPEARAIAKDSDGSIKMLTVIVRHEVLNQRRKQARRARALAMLELESDT